MEKILDIKKRGRDGQRLCNMGYDLLLWRCCQKTRGIAFNGIYTSQIDYLNSLVCKSLEDETVSLFELYNTNLIRYKEQDAESIFKSDF